MGTIWTQPDADYSADAIAYAAPVDGAAYLNFFENSKSVRRNLASGEPWASVVGNPPVVGGLVYFSGGQNYVQTTVADLAEATILLVAGMPSTATGNVFIVSTNGAGGGVGSSVWYDCDNGLIKTGGARSGGAVPIASLSTAPTTFNFFAARFDATRHRIDMPRTGANNSAGGVAAARQTANGFYRIGSDYVAATGPQVITPFVAIIPRYLSDAEVTAFYNRVKRRQASLGRLI